MTPLPKILTLQIWVRISIFNKHPPTCSVSLFWKLNRLDGPYIKWWLPLSFKAKVKSHPVTSGTLPDLVLSTSLTSSPWSPVTLCSSHTGLFDVPQTYQTCPQLRDFAFVLLSVYSALSPDICMSICLVSFKSYRICHFLSESYPAHPI